MSHPHHLKENHHLIKRQYKVNVVVHQNDSLGQRNYSKQQTSSIHPEEASAFDRGLDAEKILGATDATVKIHFLLLKYFICFFSSFRVS